MIYLQSQTAERAVIVLVDLKNGPGSATLQVLTRGPRNQALWGAWQDTHPNRCGQNPTDERSEKACYVVPDVSGLFGKVLSIRSRRGSGPVTWSKSSASSTIAHMRSNRPGWLLQNGSSTPRTAWSKSPS